MSLPVVFYTVVLVGTVVLWIIRSYVSSIDFPPSYTHSTPLVEYEEESNYTAFDHLFHPAVSFSSQIETPRYCTNSNCKDALKEQAWLENHHSTYQSRTSKKVKCPSTVTIEYDTVIGKYWRDFLPQVRAKMSDCSVSCNAYPASMLNFREPSIYLNMFSPKQGLSDKSTAKRALMSLENFAGYHMLKYESDVDFDMLVSYSKDSDVWVNYFYGYSPFNNIDIKSDSSGIHNDTVSALFISNCGGNYGSQGKPRQELINQLIKLGGPDYFASFGHCFPPRIIEKEFLGKHISNLPKNPSKYDRKHAIAEMFPFHFAFENSVSSEYLTEKLFQALSVRAIPVLFGAFSVAELEPYPRPAWINALDYETPTDLYKEIERIKNDPEALKLYSRWMENDKFLHSKVWKSWAKHNLENVGKDSFFCHICENYVQNFCEDEPL